ncbi:ABC transporter permease subunit [Gudongella sp. DL1XJH-153]|uniref:carbohydrate ABC transporter permease n=1 Tax=Gudongella sp. DL1XJH-153 TaxID=3409804 RepID=UPI003BB6E9E5
MTSYSLYLKDNIGNKFERKNKYLLELAKLDEKIKEETDKKKKSLLQSEKKNLIANKKKHPHNIKLKEFHKEEKDFLRSLKNSEADFEKSLSDTLNSKVRQLKTRMYHHKQRTEFYKEYVELTYEAEFKFKKSKINVEQIPEIISFIEGIESELDEAMEQKNKLDPKKDARLKIELKTFKEEAKKKRDEEIKKVKERKKEGVISSKAETNAIRELKREYKNQVKLESYKIPSKENKDFIKSKQRELSNGIKREEKVLKADIADARRKIPMEIAKKRPIIAYLTPVLPGLGQLINGQRRKAIFFFLVSFFVYFIAIPYALGYGNYQGEGIAGLITLAEGGARVHKSLIFMIEGVVAIFLLLIAIGLLYASFRDVLLTERNMISGIRPPNWFETKRMLFQEGFPYISSLPAMLVIVFIVLVPVITTLLVSFTNMNPQNQSKFTWIGIENYKLIALGEGLAGSVFWLIFVWTVIWTLVATTLAILLGFFLALLVNNDRIKGKKFFRTIYILPWAVPAFITIMFFSIMVAPGGVITELLDSLFNARIEIKNDTILTRAALILIQGWLGSAYVFLLTTGVLQAIPGDLYEAADIDGASTYEKLRRITVPLVLFQIAPLLVTQYTFNFNNFSVIFLFNSGGPFDPQRYGNLAGSSDLLISYVYKLALVNQYQAIAAAITIFISLGVMFFAFLGFRRSKGFKEGRL